ALEQSTKKCYDVVKLIRIYPTGYRSLLTLRLVQKSGAGQLLLPFSAKVNEKAFEGATPGEIANTANVSFENEDGTSFNTDTPEITTEVEKGTATINKVDSQTKAALSGATFALYRKAVTGDTGAETITVAGESVSVVKVMAGTPAAQVTATSGTDGKAVFSDLAAGTYYAVETVAPTGYNKLTQGVLLGTLTTVNGAISAEVTVQNVKRGEIPQTGGMGTIVFTAVGIGLMGIALAFFVKNKKKASDVE
ncbi:MAG: SpaA isopeptide-forming pilin-related protein, partial [Lachnospiraceae bacterium]